MVAPHRSQAHSRLSLLHWAHRRLLQPLAAPPLSPSLDFRFACFAHCARRSSVPLGARFVRPPPLPSSIRNGRPASSHRAVFGGPVFRLCGLRFALCPRGFSRFAASDESRTPLLIGLTTACFRHRRRPSCAPLQFPLKSYGFSGAETARKRFLLWKMGFSAAKIAPSPPYTPPGTIKARKGFGSTLALSPGVLTV